MSAAGSEASPFTLTVPGTDTVLRESDGRLSADGAVFSMSIDGVWDLTTGARRARLDRFAADYAAVRAAEQREMTAAEVRELPRVPDQHPLAAMWRERACSHQRFKRAIAALEPGRVIDVGAGCGWLAADLVRDGWTAAAVDITVTGGDGLAAALHHHEPLLLARAEMEALPFPSASVDLAVFNASLHYATNIGTALTEAARVVRPGGSIVVLDSPVFRDPAAGATMVAEFAASVRRSHGLAAAELEGPGFIAQSELDGFAFSRLDGSWWLRRRLSRWRRRNGGSGRETATRPLLIATVG